MQQPQTPVGAVFRGRLFTFRPSSRRVKRLPWHRISAQGGARVVDLLLITVIAVIAIALLFDFTNGFHDAANSVATVVATRAMPAKWALGSRRPSTSWRTSSSARPSPTPSPRRSRAEYGGVAVVFAALFAAIAWNYVTWCFGMPSSSSHAIIGGLVGAGLAAGGLDAIDWSSVEKAAIAIVLSPAVAFSIAFVAMYLVFGIQKLSKWHDDHPAFKGLQLCRCRRRLLRPRRQRRAEDDGRDRRPAARRRLHRDGRGRQDRRGARVGGAVAPTAPSRSARCGAAGRSSRRWA